MNPFPTLSTLSRELRHDSVRDLAWTLLSPPLMQQPPGAQRHPLAACGWVDQPCQLAAWLRRLDHDPQPLEHWLALRGSRRLGLYYERLWQFALGQAPGVELLATNLPIRQGGRTLGELDALLRDRTGTHHLELAIKLYLGPPQAGGEDVGQWLGPGCHDRLGMKLAHLAGHQLPMAAQPESQAALAALGIGAVQSHLWLGGYLFYPWPQGCAAPVGVAADHLRGHWLRRKDWPEFAASRRGGQWQPLARERWLAPARMAEHERWPATRFEDWLAALEADAAARLLVHLEPSGPHEWQEQERVFLVADHWPAPGAA